jgi:hypothetical protein
MLLQGQADVLKLWYPSGTILPPHDTDVLCWLAVRSFVAGRLTVYAGAIITPGYGRGEPHQMPVPRIGTSNALFKRDAQTERGPGTASGFR